KASLHEHETASRFADRATPLSRGSIRIVQRRVRVSQLQSECVLPIDAPASALQQVDRTLRLAAVTPHCCSFAIRRLEGWRRTHPFRYRLLQPLDSVQVGQHP